jgi:hypothetical protein
MKAGIVGILVASALMIGCGNPSKEDVCGSCSGDTKTACEIVYDACDDDGDCIEALEDAKPCG